MTSLFHPHRLVLTTHRIPRPAGALGLRILHLSDLHASRPVPLTLIQEAVELGLAQDPDLIVVTGDFVTSTLPETPAFARLLERLPRHAPTFACLGNHDGGAWAGDHGGYPTPEIVSTFVQACGLRVLDNASATVTRAGRLLEFVGLRDLWSDDPDPNAAFADACAAPDLRVVLAHNPDCKDHLAAEHAWDLMLSGHTHGGQIRLPFLGGRWIAPVKDRRFIDGLHAWNNRHLHISRGIGSIWGLRFNCRPEVAVVEV